MKKTLLSFIILFISFNCFGTEKEIAYAVSSTGFLLDPLVNIVAGYAAEINSDEWLDVLNKLNELAPITSNFRNKAIQSLTSIIIGNIGNIDNLFDVLNGGAVRMPKPYPQDAVIKMIDCVLKMTPSMELRMNFLNNAKNFEEIMLFFKYMENHLKRDRNDNDQASIFRNAINQLEILKKLASTKNGIENLLRLYNLTYERFSGNNWNEAWTLNPTLLQEQLNK